MEGVRAVSGLKRQRVREGFDPSLDSISSGIIVPRIDLSIHQTGEMTVAAPLSDPLVESRECCVVLE